VKKEALYIWCSQAVSPDAINDLVALMMPLFLPLCQQWGS
jgi:hypothetical protein